MITTDITLLPEIEGSKYKPLAGDYHQLDIRTLVKVITNHYHANARKHIVVIYDLAQEVFSMHSERHPELAQLVERLYMFVDNLLFHLKKEEEILFPNVIQLSEKKSHKESFSSFGVIKDCVLIMKNDHEYVGRQLKFFRGLTKDYSFPANCSKSHQLLLVKMKEFEKEMIQHILLESDFLFPKAIQMDTN